jgi:ubiquitin C-terminal hydrolase
MKNKKQTESGISYSVEHLHHFNCGSCKRWWSIGDVPKGKKSWYCPWCGVLQKVAKNITPKKLS